MLLKIEFSGAYQVKLKFEIHSPGNFLLPGEHTIYTGLIFIRIEIVYITTTSIHYEMHPSKNLSESHSLHEKNLETY